MTKLEELKRLKITYKNLMKDLEAEKAHSKRLEEKNKALKEQEKFLVNVAKTLMNYIKDIREANVHNSN